MPPWRSWPSGWAVGGWPSGESCANSRSPARRRCVVRTGARVLPAPPWSPDLIPIEKMFSKVKGLLRSAAARASEALVDAMAQALAAVCSPDILGWFKSCGLAGGPDRPASEGQKDLLGRLQVEGLCATQP